MDRLICGDVGFGKTEVALRAAFAVALDGKQVAVVVPTTLLARQHSKTFTERFRGFPVNVAQASRLVAPKELSQVKKNLTDGAVDIVVGTHALLGKIHKIQGSRSSDRRRGAAFRRQPQGTAQTIARQVHRADAECDANPAHAATGADGSARSLHHRLAAGRPARGPHLRGAA